MARDWSDLFVIDGAPAGGEAAGSGEDEVTERRRGRFARLRENLRKTRRALASEIQATFSGELDEEGWERLEREATAGGIGGSEALTERLTALLAEIARVGDDHIDLSAKPTVILVAGVNGTGKTTTSGKLAHHLSREFGLGVVLVAADTFRAAAVEQLEQWAQRAGAAFVRGPDGADPGSVAYEGMTRSIRDGADVVIIDTAGRLHT